MKLGIGDKVKYKCGITGEQLGIIRDTGLIDNGKKTTYQVLLDNGNIIELMNTELLEKIENE